VHERIVHFIEVATTHWLGGQHGEEGKGEEESREEGEAESEALTGRLQVFGTSPKTQRLTRLITPAFANEREMTRAGRVGNRGRWRDRGL